MQIPEGTEIEAHTGYATEEGWDIDYRVHEAIPKAKPEEPKVDEHGIHSFLSSLNPPYRGNGDFREDALRIDSDTIEVHHVEWVRVSSTRFAVSRGLYEKRDLKF